MLNTMLVFLATLAWAQDLRLNNNNSNDARIFPTTPSPANSRMDVPLCDMSSTQSALMIIDMQDQFVLRGGKALSRENGNAVTAAIDEQIRAIEHAKKANLPIVIVEYFGYGPTNSRLKEAVAGYAKAKTILKSTDGIFDHDNVYKRDLASFLFQEKVKTLMVLGANGGACVRQSIAGALQANCSVISTERGVADFNYRKFIFPYQFKPEYNSFMNTRYGSCVNCQFRQVRQANDLTPFMVNNQNSPTNRAQEPDSETAR